MPAMDESVLKKISPQSIEAEQSVIGSMIMSKDAITIASEILSPEDFYSKQYGAVYKAMVDLHSEGRPVDPVTLRDRLKAMDVPPEVSELGFIKDLLSAVPTSVNIKHYADIVAAKATMRRLIKACEEIEANCYKGQATLDYILDDAEGKVFNIVQNRGAEDFTPIREIVGRAIDRMEMASRNKSAVTGIATGFRDLDAKTAGMQPSDFVLIAARPSMGKTAFVLNIAEYVAFRSHLPLVIFSLEMSREQLVNRLISMESRVDSSKIRTGNLREDDWDSIVESAGVIAGSKLIIDDTPGISINDLRSKCRKYKMEHDLSMIIIDYLQLMQGNGKGESRQQEISEISRALKGLARELNVPVLALSQLSRAVEQRPDHRPMLSDLRESGAIEQDADVVMFIYRDDYYHPDTEKKGLAEIIIAKQRNGPIGSVDLVWLADFTKFADLEMRR